MRLREGRADKRRAGEVIRFSTVVLGVILIGVFSRVPHPLLLVGSVFCFGVVLPALVLSQRLSPSGCQNGNVSGAPYKGPRRISLTLLLSASLGFVLVGLAPYVYTPPAFTHENVVLYRRCVNFALSHPELGEFTLSWSGRLYTDDGTWLVKADFDREELRRRLSDQDIKELGELAGLMHRLRCFHWDRRKEIVLFYRRRNVFFPNRPGVAYSLRGNNLDHISCEEMPELSPLVQVMNNWYLSRRLVVGGLRTYYLISVSHSLIDRATRIDDVITREMKV